MTSVQGAFTSNMPSGASSTIWPIRRLVDVLLCIEVVHHGVGSGSLGCQLGELHPYIERGIKGVDPKLAAPMQETTPS
jgi:hypothetical protein